MFIICNSRLEEDLVELMRDSQLKRRSENVEHQKKVNDHNFSDDFRFSKRFTIDS